MSDGGILRANIHGRDRIRSGFRIQHQRLTGYGRLRTGRILLHNYTAAEGADPSALADGSGIHIGAGILAGMDNLGAGVQILTGSGEGNACKFHTGIVAL